MNKKQFKNGLNPKLQQHVQAIESIKIGKQKVFYAILNPNIVPLEFRETGIVSSLLEICSPNITDDTVFISIPEDKEYQKLIYYIVASEYLKKVHNNSPDIWGNKEMIRDGIETNTMHNAINQIEEKINIDPIKKNLSKFYSKLLQHENSLSIKSNPVRQQLLCILNHITKNGQIK